MGQIDQHKFAAVPKSILVAVSNYLEWQNASIDMLHIWAVIPTQTVTNLDKHFSFLHSVANGFLKWSK